MKLLKELKNKLEHIYWWYIFDTFELFFGQQPTLKEHLDELYMAIGASYGIGRIKMTDRDKKVCEAIEVIQEHLRWEQLCDRQGRRVER